MNMTVFAASACPTAVNPVPSAPEASLTIYPNPNNGAFVINVLAENNEAAQITVYSISGERIKEFTTTTNTATDMRLPHVAGMYFVSVTTAHGNYSGRLLIQ
jgi:hypothetical protein